ncbi:MAG: hypothetical protein Unbinned2716contig1000_37 [Prokaryotic dsDNA virus sp.]|nr:MAG: hypothetical protein Unbinned2716contig1000_37 [Prokaryotic dsDNA virus sp.]|tara:strand:+ start:10740 stop:11096 length:357 start_codon:yes stop_codon:yes gene_type:complete
MSNENTKKYFEVSGKVDKIGNNLTIKKKDGGELFKRSILIDTGAEYNPIICFDAFQEELRNSMDKLEVGEVVTVKFNLSSREYDGRYFHNVNAFSIEAVYSKKKDVAVTSDDKDDFPF